VDLKKTGGYGKNVSKQVVGAMLPPKQIRIGRFFPQTGGRLVSRNRKEMGVSPKQVGYGWLAPKTGGK